ncbi:TrkH family potassium uptake protein [Euzebya tangerina]|uniref:TrkH family potassium uptake protein n=1 Tax=Euzebya tangerina TaxID=591198 RepID=UPI000E31972F|nr:potassium transporter TrkG [Euzebya tangerina]
MLFRPGSDDLRLILLYTGRVIFGVGLAMALPAVLAVIYGEFADGWSFLLSGSLAVITGRAAELYLQTAKRLDSSHALATVSLAWLTAPVFCAMPLFMSGHYASFLDAYFEGMSGIATIGLTLANDLDHMARSVNFWRHLMHFLGGQGIVVIILTAFSTGAARLGTLYTGEGREDVILPNIVRTARFIWRVALVYALIGTSLLWAAVTTAGLPVLDGLYHAFNLFIAAFDTGGFATQSSSVAFYRSQSVEAVLLVIMVAGAFSFALHYQLWQGRRSELFKNTETRMLFTSVMVLLTVMVIGLVRSGTFETFLPLYRHALFNTVSAQTTTGLGTVPGRLYVTDWGVLAPAVIVTGMAIGGMAGSTAGGLKAIRLGLVLKGLRHDIRRVLLPEDAVIVESYHAGGRSILKAPQVRDAALFVLLWLSLYAVGAVLGLFYGYPLELALFESVAAASSGGLSVGLARPDLETPLKVVYILQMVVGRLEFISIFALVGYVVSVIRGKA